MLGEMTEPSRVMMEQTLIFTHNYFREGVLKGSVEAGVITKEQSEALEKKQLDTLKTLIREETIEAFGRLGDFSWLTK